LRTEYLASVVARFCNSPSIIEGGTWELRVELNPSILADTRLFLQLSSYRLLLRFETENQRSKGLIYDNTNELGARLHSLLQGKVDVEVANW
jgi:type III secretion control protein HpaP